MRMKKIISFNKTEILKKWATKSYSSIADKQNSWWEIPEPCFYGYTEYTASFQKNWKLKKSLDNKSWQLKLTVIKNLVYRSSRSGLGLINE